MARLCLISLLYVSRLVDLRGIQTLGRARMRCPNAVAEVGMQSIGRCSAGTDSLRNILVFVVVVCGMC